MYEQMTITTTIAERNFEHQFRKTKKEIANNPFSGGKHRESQQQ